MKQDEAVILIVDDKPARIRSFESLLACENRSVLNAASEKEVFLLVLNKEIDLIILDMQSAVMNFEVLQLLQSDERAKNIPVLFILPERTEQQLPVSQHVDYFYEPLGPEAFNAKVNVMLRLQFLEKELLEKNRSLDRMTSRISNSADISAIVDAASYRIEELNEAFTGILGYSLEEAKAQSFLSFLSEKNAALLQHYNEQEQLSFEAPVSCKDRSVKWLRWNIAAKHGKWLVNASDISQVKKLNSDLQSSMEQLQLLDKELEAFSFSISHDLRAPLRALGNYSVMLEEDYKDKLDEDGKHFIRQIKSHTAQMNRLINDLLAFSRLNKKIPEKSPVDMESIVNGVLKEIYPQGENRPEIKVLALPPAYGDYSLLHQVWSNLISNAIKYSSKKEEIHIEIGTLAGADKVVYYIKDNGAGFDMLYADKLFGVFQRLHGQTEFEGSGVGLAIAQRILSKHAGTIWAEAKPGEGATFYFTLPQAMH